MFRENFVKLPYNQKDQIIISKEIINDITLKILKI